MNESELKQRLEEIDWQITALKAERGKIEHELDRIALEEMEFHYGQKLIITPECRRELESRRGWDAEALNEWKIGESAEIVGFNRKSYTFTLQNQYGGFTGWFPVRIIRGMVIKEGE